MNTTNLFVELVVIGVGVFIWLALLVFAFFGVSWMQVNNSLLISSALPALAFIYVLGIVWDRFCDTVFDRFWGKAIRDQSFDNVGEYYNDRRNIMLNSQPLSDLLEYGRSRLRICRGWAINAIMTGLCFNLFVWRQLGEHARALELAFFGGLGCALLAIGCWLAWRNLTRVEYRKIKDQSVYLSMRVQDDS
jgi:hypothetical protein